MQSLRPLTFVCSAFRRSFASAFAACFLLALPGCGLFQPSAAELQEMGDAQAPQLVAEFGGGLPNRSVVDYVTARGQEVASVSGAAGQVWTFHVLNSDVVNAFALPGGHIFITKGMMVRLTDEAQLVGVLGHEVGHVMAEHTAERLDKVMTAQFGLGVAAAALGRGELEFGVDSGGAVNEDAVYSDLALMAAEVGSEVALLAYSREDEIEADKLGVQYMATLGYNPTGQIGVMRVLASLGAGGSDPEFLKTHPNPETRIDELNAFIAEKFPNYTDPLAFRFNQERYQQMALQPLGVGASAGMIEPDAVPSLALGEFVGASAWRNAHASGHAHHHAHARHAR
ncbi:MAG: M48 family metallopeptidase [Planctomycetota bacterium]